MSILDFGTRLYDAVLGRWIVQDPVHQIASPYLAMCNNPVSNIDPDVRLSEECEEDGGGVGWMGGFSEPPFGFQGGRM